MGAWGIGSFENDVAADWAAGFLERPSVEAIDRALREVAGADDYIEADAAVEALAAAEVVAAAGRGAAADVPAELVAWAQAHLRPTPPALTRAAGDAVEAVLHSSELRELWDETKDAGAWAEAMVDLQQRLGGRP